MLAAGARRLGFDASGSWSDLAYGFGFFFCYAVADVLTRGAARLTETGAAGRWMLPASLAANPLPTLVLVLAAAGSAWRCRDRLLCRWSDIDRGPVLRLVTVPLLVLLTWQGSLYQFNYLLDRAHPADRLLLVALAAAVVWRPVALVAFVVQSRVIATQFDFPFGTAAAQNIDELLVIALLCVAGAHLMYVATGRPDSSPVILVLAAAIATHFFIPGRGKLMLDWVVHEDLANLAGNGYTVGWLGQTDGGFARSLVRLIQPIDGALRVATVVLELGAVLAAAHHRLLRVWLPVIIGFHIVNFLTLGFWFLGWLALEITVLVVLSRDELRPWLDRNLTPTRAGLTVVMVGVFGASLFHPPGLAWFDTPLGYGYQLEVEGESGQVYNLPIEAFAPFSQELAFSRLQLGERQRLTGAYGVVVSVEELDRINGLTTVEDVEALEAPAGPEAAQQRAAAERFLAAFLAYANDRSTGGNGLAEVLDVVEPLPKYWTGRPDPRYDFQEPIVTLEVQRVTNLRVDDRFQRSVTSVLTMAVG